MKKGIQPMHPGKASGHEGFSPNPDISNTTGGKQGSMEKPNKKSSGKGVNKAGGDAGECKPL